MNKQYRNINDYEKSILDKLFEASFAGSKELKKQIDESLVCEFEHDNDGCGSLEFKTTSPIKAVVKNRVPVEARFVSDEYPVDILLHVLNGVVKELEFVYYNKVKKPKLQDLVVTIKG